MERTHDSVEGTAEENFVLVVERDDNEKFSLSIVETWSEAVSVLVKLLRL